MHLKVKLVCACLPNFWKGHELFVEHYPVTLRL